MEYNPALRLPEFAAGIAIGILWMRRDVRGGGWLRVRAVPRDVSVLIVLASLCALTIMPVGLPLAFPFGAIVGLPLSMLIVLLASGHGMVARFLSARLLVWLGEISYGVYILHWPLWWWTARAAGHVLHIPSSAPMLLPLYLVVLVASAGASYRWIETPTRRAIRARWTRSYAAPQDVVTSVVR